MDWNFKFVNSIFLIDTVQSQQLQEPDPTFGNPSFRERWTTPTWECQAAQEKIKHWSHILSLHDGHHTRHLAYAEQDTMSFGEEEKRQLLLE